MFKLKPFMAKFVLIYLKYLAKLQLKKVNPFIIGVGGASGKTSLSNFIHLILSADFKVKQGKGKNSETGIPLDILDISVKNYTKADWLKALIQAPLKVFLNFNKFDIYVAEMGIDGPLEPKNMSYLLKIIKPNAAVLTNIAYEHSQYFDPLVGNVGEQKREEDILDLTAKQEALLLTDLPTEGTAVINLDDEHIALIVDQIKAKKITVSRFDNKADFFIEKIQNFVDRFVVTFTHGEKSYQIEISNPLPIHFAYSFLLAIASAFVKLPDINRAISILQKDFSLPAGRMTVFKGIKDTVLIDSSYNNATLTPILDLLDFVGEIGAARRRVGIIGDMRELGTMSRAMHEEVAKRILKTLDVAILIGPLSQKYIEPILKTNKFEYKSYQNFTQLKGELVDIVKPKDMVLVKGSQNTLFLERVVEMLLRDPKDSEKLCRRGEFWDKIRDKSL